MNDNWGHVLIAPLSTPEHIDLAEYAAPAPLDRATLAALCLRGWKAAEIMTRVATSELEPRGSGQKFVMMGNALNTAVNQIVRLLEIGAADEIVRAADGMRVLTEFEAAHIELFNSLN
jgi:hypothetical protein